MRRAFVILLLLMPLAGAGLGRLAGPFLARASDTVRLAAEVRAEEAEGVAGLTLETEAFWGTGAPAESLYAEALRAQGRLVAGGTLLGAWLGLVVAVKLFVLARAPRQDTYEIAQARCVACGRCFLCCPRERHRLEQLAARKLTGAAP